MTTSSPGRARLQRPPALILGAVGLGVVAHLAASLGAHGVMAAVMALMALACLSCLVSRREAPGALRAHRMCVHFMVMTVVMIAVHVAWIVMLGGGSHGHSHGAMATTSSHADPHTTTMLAVVGIEFVCLVLGALALRRTRALGPGRARVS